MAPPPVASQSAQPATPAATHMAAPLPLDGTHDPDAGDTATAAPTTDTGAAVDTDPNPVTTDILADEHISLFLRHARRRAEDMVADLAMDAAPPDTNTGVAVDPTPGVVAPVVAVGPATDVDVGTADGVLPGATDFDPIPAGSGRDEVRAVASDSADFEPTSLGSASNRGSDATAAMIIDTGRVVGGVSDGGFGTGAFADEVLSGDVVDFDPHPAWDGGGEITAALPDGAPTVATTVATAVSGVDVGAVATSSVTIARKRKGRGKANNVAKDERKRQRRAAFLPTTQGNTDTEAGT